MKKLFVYLFATIVAMCAVSCDKDNPDNPSKNEVEEWRATLKPLSTYKGVTTYGYMPSKPGVGAHCWIQGPTSTIAGHSEMYFVNQSTNATWILYKGNLEIDDEGDCVSFLVGKPIGSDTYYIYGIDDPDVFTEYDQEWIDNIKVASGKDVWALIYRGTHGSIRSQIGNG